MKVQKNFYNYESLKSMISYKDVFNFLISIFGIIISNVQLMEYMKLSNGNNFRIIVCDIIICAVIVFVNIYSFMNRREATKNQIDIQQLEEKNKNLLEVTDNMRCFKHDFNNIIQAIDGYIYLDDMQSLQVYFKSLLDDCNHVNAVDILNCHVIENPAIYGVLLNKYKIAEQNNIQMNIEILVSLKQLDERSYVVSRMLGILLDNAIEATNECKEKIVNVQFIKEPNKNRSIIVIENTYQNKDVDTCKIFEKNYTTKKDKGNTGLGLWKIQDILRKDNSLDLFTSKDDVMFKQQLEIYEKNVVS